MDHDLTAEVMQLNRGALADSTRLAAKMARELADLIDAGRLPDHGGAATLRLFAEKADRVADSF